jgi:hypothetical protein
MVVLMFYTITVVREGEQTENGPLEREEIPMYVRDFIRRQVPYSDGNKKGFFVSQRFGIFRSRLDREQLPHVA